MPDPATGRAATQSTASLAAAIEAALARLDRGALVAYPTESVWGLAVDSGSPDAVAALYAWKGRARRQPISVMISAPHLLARFAGNLPPAADVLARRFWPGPLTLVVPLAAAAARRFAPGIVSETGGLGVRCSPHPVAQALARGAEDAALGPPTATSLNRSGQVPVRDRAGARALCGASPGGPWVLDAGEDAHGAAVSSVIDLCASPPRLLREGAVAAAELSEALGAPLLVAAPARRV